LVGAALQRQEQAFSRSGGVSRGGEPRLARVGADVGCVDPEAGGCRERSNQVRDRRVLIG
jgi:hypothetical protein